MAQNGEEADETGDCADRTCPYEIAWTDSPDESGAHHTYAECANKGMCDRITGQVKTIKIDRHSKITMMKSCNHHHHHAIMQSSCQYVLLLLLH